MSDFDDTNARNAALQGQLGVQVGHGLVMDSLHALETQKKDLQIDQLKQQIASTPVYMPSSKGMSPEERYQQALLQEQMEKVQKENVALREALKDRDECIVEWMHANEAYKRLYQKYAKRLGIDKETRSKDVAAEIVSAAEENPSFGQTRLLGRATGKTE